MRSMLELHVIDMLQQIPAPAPSGSPLDNAAVQAALVVAAGVLLQAIFKDVASVVHSFAEEIPKRLENGRKERMSQTKAFQTQVDQNEKLFGEIERRDKQLAEFAQTLLEAQKLTNEQRSSFIQERQTWREEMATMVEQVKVKDSALEALAKENGLLKAENEALREENQRLKDELSKHSTGEHPAVQVSPPAASIE